MPACPTACFFQNALYTEPKFAIGLRSALCFAIICREHCKQSLLSSTGIIENNEDVMLKHMEGAEGNFRTQNVWYTFAAATGSRACGMNNDEMKFWY